MARASGRSCQPGAECFNLAWSNACAMGWLVSFLPGPTCSAELVSPGGSTHTSCLPSAGTDILSYAQQVTSFY